MHTHVKVWRANTYTHTHTSVATPVAIEGYVCRVTSHLSIANVNHVAVNSALCEHRIALSYIWPTIIIP